MRYLRPLIAIAAVLVLAGQEYSTVWRTNPFGVIGVLTALYLVIYFLFPDRKS